MTVAVLTGQEEDMDKKKDTQKAEGERHVRPEDLVAYCGHYCGKCGICGFNIALNRKAVKNVVETAGFQREAAHLGWPTMREIATHCCEEFENQVGSFTQFVGSLFPTWCRDGCVPPCEIASCCKEKGYFTCAECAEMDSCKILAERYKDTKPNLAEIKKTGVKAWAEKQSKEAREARREALKTAIDEAFDE